MTFQEDSLGAGVAGTTTASPARAENSGDSAALVRKAKRNRHKEWLLAAALLTPNLILLAVFTYRPLLDNIRLSFFQLEYLQPHLHLRGLG